MNAVVLIRAAAQRFSEAAKYTLGSRLLDSTTNCVVLIGRATQKVGRLQVLDRLCFRLADSRVLASLGNEVRLSSRFSTVL